MLDFIHDLLFSKWQMAKIDGGRREFFILLPFFYTYRPLLFERGMVIFFTAFYFRVFGMGIGETLWD